MVLILRNYFINSSRRHWITMFVLGIYTSGYWCANQLTLKGCNDVFLFCFFKKKLFLYFGYNVTNGEIG